MAYYNPNPTRVWSRVQNVCPDTSTLRLINNIPLQGQQMLEKGNILQYKKNSSNLTKQQKYSQLAKGFGPNRCKTFATQSITYSNPNTNSFKRINSTILPNNPSGVFQNNVPNPFNCSTDVIEDNGSLICNIIVEPCTNEIIKQKTNPLCYLSSASDVPGKIVALCWNDGIQTWYPRKRYVMSVSGNKFPVGYKGLVSAYHLESPVLSVVSQTENCIILSWSVTTNNCIPILNFEIYQNELLILTVPYSETTVTICDLTFDYENYFYIVSVNNSVKSEPSNIVTNSV
jgi:hypothetical protein